MADKDNLNFRKPHMTFVEGYFYMFDDDSDMLLQKTDDGVTSFSYPFDTLMTGVASSIEHDGINFWSMETGGTANTKLIKRWRIENYTCKLKDEITLSNPVHYFNANTFTVEHYHCTISGGYSAGDTIITTNNVGILPGELLAGMAVTIGPNSSGELETINVQHVSGEIITIADPLVNNYSNDDPLLFYNYLWVFNNSHGTDSSTGCLYKLNAYSGSIIAQYPGGVYKGIMASTFAEITHFTSLGVVDSLMYVKASNLLFVDINSASLDYHGSMAMDTIDDNEIDILEVYDLAVYNKNLYRLQRSMTYFGNTYSFSQYNYQAATFNSMVASISMVTSPNVIAANEVSISEITARVRDQFALPVVGRLVYFEVEAGSGGSIVTGQTIVNTDSDGKALSSYRAGDTAELVVIKARVDQV